MNFLPVYQFVLGNIILSSNMGLLDKKWEHPTANRKLPSLEKYYFILLISKGLYIKTSLRVMALEISIYSKNETGQISITLPE